MTAYYCRSNGNDGNDGLSDANAVTTPSVLDGLVNAGGGPHVGYLNRGQTWTDTVFGANLVLYLTAAGTGTAEASRTRIDAYGAGAKPILDKEWTNPGDYTAILRQDGDYQRISNIEVRNVGPENSASDSGGRGAHNAASVNSPEWYGVDIDGAWRDGIVMEDYLGTGVVDGCDVTNVNRSQPNGFNWGGGISSIRTMNGAVVAGIIRNNTVHEQYGEALVAHVAEDTTITNNWAWGNWALQLYMECSRDCAAYLNRLEGTTQTAFHRSGNASGAALGHDIEAGNSTSRAQQADNGNVAYYLNLVSYCATGIYWPGYAHPDAGAPTNIDFDHNTIVDCNQSFESYSPEASSSGCSFRCNISMPLTTGMLHDNNEGMHTGVNPNYNYWENSEDASPHASLQGANDVTSSALNLATMSGWRSSDGDNAVTDYYPQSDQGGTDLGYGLDFINSSITMDEFGAIKYAAAVTVFPTRTVQDLNRQFGAHRSQRMWGDLA